LIHRTHFNQAVHHLALFFRGSDRNEDYLLRILLDSGFGTKCGAPHFVPLLLRAH
jgi:hypothetical protein